MSDPTLLRAVYDAQPDMDDALFESVRERLTTEWAGGPARVGRTAAQHRRRLRLIGVAGVAAAAAAVLVAVTVFGFGGGSRSASAVAETLAQAAVDTIHVEDPLLTAGEYLHVRTDYIAPVSAFSDTGPVRTWLIRGSDDEWVPADPDADWVRRTGVGTPFRYFSSAAKKAALSGESQVDHSPLVQRGEDGVYAPTATGSAPPWTPESLRALPTDADALLTALAHRMRTSTADHDAMFEALTEILDTGFAPATTRATVFRAIATVPGVEITERSADLAGRAGIAIGRVDGSRGVRLDLVIDPRDGVVIGTRQVLTRAARGMPAGTVESSTAVTTTVDDALPTLR